MQEVSREEDDGDLERQLVFEKRLVLDGERRVPYVLFENEVEHGRNDEADRRERQEGRPDTGRRAVELLPLAADAADERGGAEDEEDVADDRAGEARLDDVL